MTLISKNFSEVITFSRGTGATRVNSAGLIVGVDFSATSNTIATGSKTFTITADANVNRDWPVGSNVIAVSQVGATGSMTGTVTSYTPSTQSLVINVVSVTGSGTSTDWRIGSLDVREDYDPVTLVKKGVLSEVSATNLIEDSVAYNSANWSRIAGLSVSSNVSLSPDGSISASKVIPSAVLNFQEIYNTSTITSGLFYSGSVYLKAGEYRYVQILTPGTELGLSFANIDLVTGTQVGGTNGFAKITLAGNGWYRVSTTALALTSSASGRFSISIIDSPTSARTSSFAGDGSSGFFIWGSQFEQSFNETSYIPTTTAQVTRNADNFPLTAAAVASIRQGEGTLYAEITCDDTGVAQKRALRLSGTNADIRIGKQGTGTLSDFTKMAEGAGLRLMGTANRLIRGNGQDLVGVTAINDRTGVAVAFPVANGVAFDGSNRFGLLSAGEEVYIDGLLGTFSGKGAAAISLGVHYNGNRFLMASNNAGVVLVSDGTSYRRVNTPVITQPANEITSGLVGGTLRNVIVGNAGFIATSDDNGETWTSRTSLISQEIRGVTFGAGLFVAAAANGTQSILTSPDGITWTRQTTPNVSLVDVHFANSIYVATSNAGAVLTSTNGTTWVAATATNTTQALNGVTYSTALNLWIVVGVAGTIITATDPAGTWTVQTSGTTQNLNEVTIFNNAIYVVGNTQTLLTSTNGTSYTSLTAGVAGSLNGIAASPTTLLITGATGAMASSTNGTTFTSRTNNNATLNGIAFGNNVFVSVGNAVNGSGYIATIGTDGTVTRRVSGTTSSLLGVKFLRSAHYAVGNNSTLSRSTDGATWTTQIIPGATVAYLDIADSGSLFVAVSANGRYSTSSDGQTFSSSTLTGVTPQQLNGIDFANGVFVAAGNAGTIITSPNGTTWTLRTSGTTQNLNSVMFSTRDNLWYAAGDGGVLLYSPDAITWTAVQNSGTASILGTTLQSNQPLPQFNSGVNKIALSYKSNQVISALNGVASTTDTTATIPSITAGAIGENFNGTIQKIEVLDSALTTSEIIEKTL